MKHAWSLAFRNLARNRGRNVMTAAAIGFGYAGLVVLGGYVVRVEHFLRVNAVYLQNVGHLSIFKVGGLEKSGVRPRAFSLSRAEQERISTVLGADPRVEFSGRYLKGIGLVGNGCKTVPFLASGIEPEVSRKILEHPVVRQAAPELAAAVRGQAFWKYQSVEGAVALSTGLAQLLGKSRVHDEISNKAAPVVVPDCAAPDTAQQLSKDSNVQLASLTHDGGLAAIDGELVTIFRTPLAETENNSLVTSLAGLQKLYETEAVTYVAAFLRPGVDHRALGKSLEAKLRAAGLDVSVYPFDDDRLSPYYVGSMGMLGAIAAFMTFLVVSVVSLATLNVMTLSVLERTREIGMFRSLGFTRGHMLSLFVREAVVLGAAALVAGGLAGLLVAWAVNHAGIRFNPPGISGSIQLIITPSAPICALMAAAILGLAVLATISAVRSKTREHVVRLLTDTVG